jgi:hypothetical protein
MRFHFVNELRRFATAILPAEHISFTFVAYLKLLLYKAITNTNPLWH